MRGSILLVAVAAAALSACGRSHAEDGGPIVQRSFPVGAFDGIEVAGPYQVTVRTGGSPSVAASGPERLMDNLVVEVKGDKLHIHPRDDRGFMKWGSRSNGKATIEISAPALRETTIAGSGDISVDRIDGPSFEGTVAGSGTLMLDSVDVRSLKLTIAGSGDLKARSGKADTVEYAIAGSGNLDAKGVRSTNAELSIAGSGNIAGNASSNAEVKIMGSGDVDLGGGAKCSVSKMGSGNVRCS